jgi:hypothetical protein
MKYLARALEALLYATAILTVVALTTISKPAPRLRADRG